MRARPWSASSRRIAARGAGIRFGVGEESAWSDRRSPQHLDVAHRAELGARASAARRAGAAPSRASTKSRSVPRSERSRRVATRAWCTASGSRSVQSAGSLASSRLTEAATDMRMTSEMRNRAGLATISVDAARLRSRDRELLQRDLRVETVHDGDLHPGAVGSRGSTRARRRRSSARGSRRVGAQAAVGDAQHRLDPAIEVARHHVGRSDHVLGVVASGLAEAEDAGVLEEAADDRTHGDPLRQAGHAGPQAADARARRGRRARPRPTRRRARR